MKLYDCTPAPSPRRARIFLAEKGIEVEKVEIDLVKGEQLSDDFKRINPRCTVPVLELDDGTVICENLGIAVYLDETYPDPPLLGRDALEKAAVMSWNARVEFDGLWAVGESFRNHVKAFRERSLTGPTSYNQIPELVARGRARATEFLTVLDQQLEDREYICGERFTLADITALVTVDFAGWIKLEVTPEQANLRRWHETVSGRPSATA